MIELFVVLCYNSKVERSWTIMATRSITDPFVVNAADWYRAILEAEKKTEERKKHPIPSTVSVSKMTKEDMDRMMKASGCFQDSKSN
jgi:hypothetical protein